MIFSISNRYLRKKKEDSQVIASTMTRKKGFVATPMASAVFKKKGSRSITYATPEKRATCDS